MFIYHLVVQLVLLKHTCLVVSLYITIFYTDFAKAFDCVNHFNLLMVLDSVGFSDTLLFWIMSYHVDKKLWVSIRGVSSLFFSSSSGVPQGAVLFCTVTITIFLFC